MWRSLWRSTDRFSVRHFGDIINEMRDIKYVDVHNREVLVDLMQSVAEIVTFGDQHDPAIFECFMEFQVLAEFVRILKVHGSSRIEAPLLQYLSIMIQNIENEHAIYYYLSNGYINSIIVHEYEFEGGDVLPYYVSFLRAVGGKIDRDTVHLLVKVHKDAVVSFPLYEGALKFVHHGEKMIQIAVRALTLKIYSVADEMIYRFLTNSPVSDYFSGLIVDLKNKCFRVDALSSGLGENRHDKKRELLLETDRVVDDLYYLKDILCIPDYCLNKLVTENIVNLLILPMLLTLLLVRQSNDRALSPITCLCILSRLLQVFDGTYLVNVVGSALVFSCTSLSMIDGLPFKGAETVMRNYFLKYLSEDIELNSAEWLSCLQVENSENEWADEIFFRSGIFSCIFSGNHNLMLASLMLLFAVAESKDLDHHLAEMIGFSEVKTASDCYGSMFTKQAKKIVKQLLKVLACEPPGSVAMLFNTAWFLRKLLVFQDQMLDDDDYHLFKTSCELSCEHLREEFNQCWFDYIPDTLRNEWANCKTVLEESSQSKDPFFALELESYQVIPREISGSEDATFVWQQMVDDVKVFILHLQLKSFICGGDALDNPLANWKSGSLAQSGRRYASDLSLASFGSEVALGSGVPCKIAFSGAGTRDVYVIPTAREISGKLLLVEQHPLHPRKGVVIAIAPLAGLNAGIEQVTIRSSAISLDQKCVHLLKSDIPLPFPNYNAKIDENHPTWLHIQLRDFQPGPHSSENRKLDSSNSIPVAQGRWILGFLNADVCKAAYSRILEEARKQRSFVESLVAPLLLEDSANFQNSQANNCHLRWGNPESFPTPENIKQEFLELASVLPN